MVVAASSPTASELDELAALTGYQDESANGKAPAPVATADASAKGIESNSEGDIEESEDSSEEKALLDPEDLVVDDATPQRLWSSPWAKLGFVGLFLGVGVFAVGAFAFGVQSRWSSTQEPVAEVVAPPELEPLDPTAQLQSETGDLKTKAALGRQATALNQTTDSVSATSDPLTPGGPTPKPATAPSPGVVSSAAPSSAVRAPVSRISEYSPPAAPRPQYSPPAASQLASAGSVSAATSARAPAVNPTEQWQSTLALGSYGQINYSPLPTSAAQSTSPGMLASYTQNSPGVVADKSNDYQQALYAADEAAILSGQPRSAATITAGTTATATLSTPIVWDQDLNSDQQPQRFGLQLTQPLLAVDGSEALPAGTQMVAQVNTVSDSGFVQLSVQAVITPTAKGNQLVVIPPGAISIQGDSGNPLMAENYHNNSGRIRRLNTQIGIIGALGKVGELLNRPSNTSTVSSPYISSTSVSNGSTNIIGGLLEGGFSSLQQQVTQQDQQEVEDILSRPNVWYVAAGQSLQVFADSSFEVGL